MRKRIIVAASVLMMQMIPLPALAVTAQDVETAITKANVLAAGITARAQINGDQAIVSTYRNTRANDQDCKIDALLIARAVIEQLPSLARVTVYFYDTADQTQFRTVSVSTGDVKAYSAGTLSKETLISSLLVNEQNSSGSASNVQINVTADEVTAAINKAKILAPGIGLFAQINGDQALISTYRNSKANDNDCKVDAVLIAKTVIQGVSSQISRVTVYFYNSVDRSKYKLVTVSAGDVKAFDAAKISKETLLASVPITEESAANNIANYLQGSQSREHPIDASIKGGVLTINTQIDSWISNRDCKYQALSLAEKALQTAPSAVTKVQVNFADTANPASVRQVSFEPETMTTLSSQFDSMLQPLSLVAVTTAKSSDLSSLTAVNGALLDQRSRLLARIQKLAKDGVGVGPYIIEFGMIEQQVGTADEATLSQRISRLSTAVDNQEKASKAAKEHQTKAVATEAPKGPARPVTINWPLETRWALGSVMPGHPIDEGRVVKEPDAYINELESQFKAARLNPNDSPFFFHALRFFVQTLNDEKQYAEASKLMQRVAQIQSTHPNFVK